MKPIYAVLTAHWFDEFASGRKTTEYRRSGPLWNADRCTIGRSIIFSRGYTKRRLKSRIVNFAIVPAADCPDIADIYPDATEIAAIGIELD